jgi:hypothetical protein
MCSWSLPAARLMTRYLLVTSAGRSPMARPSSMRMPNKRLLSRRARFSSFLHQPEPSHAVLIRNSTASHRRAASLRARSQRSLLRRPRGQCPGTNHPSPRRPANHAAQWLAHCRSCEMNIRDTGYAPGGSLTMSDLAALGNCVIGASDARRPRQVLIGNFFCFGSQKSRRDSRAYNDHLPS